MMGQSKFHHTLGPRKFNEAAFIQKVNSEINRRGDSTHKTILEILALRDQYTDSTNRPGNLKTDTFQCIYIFFHLHSKKVYIGQTGDLLFKRFTFHRSSAREIGRHDDNHFYSHLRNYGLDDVYLIPLQIIPGNYAHRHTRSSGLPYFHTVASPIEQKWIDRFNAHPDFSMYNSSNACNYSPASTTAGTSPAAAAAGTSTDATTAGIATTAANTTPLPSSQETTSPSQEASQPTQNTQERHSNRGRRRHHITRLYDHKIKYLLSRFNNKSLATTGIDFFIKFFEKYNTKTLQKTLLYLQNTAAFSLHISTAEHSNLREILTTVTAARFPPRTDVYSTYKLIKIPGEFKPYFDYLDLSNVFKNSKQFLPAGVTQKPIITSQFTKPLSTTFMNTHDIAKSSPATISSTLSSPCSCRSTQFQPYVNAALGHVCTHNVNILPTVALQKLAKMGTNYRLGLSGFTVTEELRNEALQLSIQAFTAFSTRYENGLQIDGWEAWKNSLQPLIQAQIDIDLPLGSSFALPASATGLPFSMADFYALRNFQHHFAITAVDKAAMSFAFMCKKNYVEHMTNDLNDSSVFQPVNITASALLASLETNIPPSAWHVLKIGVDTIPNYVCMIKLHKPIPQPRFIVSASLCYSTTISKTLCTVLGTLDIFTKSLLADAFARLDNHLATLPSSSTAAPPTFTWHGHHTILRNAAEMVERCHSFNAMHTNTQVNFQTADVSRLYTSLNLDPVFTRLVGIYTKIFNKYGYAIKIFDTPGKTPEWLPPGHYPPEARRGGTGYSKHTIFTLEDLIKLLEFTIKNNYMTFAQQILHQTKGISMGGNASVYVANHFLFTYELDFYSRLVDIITANTTIQVLPLLPTEEPQNWQLHYDTGSVALYLLDIFQWLFRFVDDNESINNNYMDKLLYTNQTFFGIQGIYPPELVITLSKQEDHSNYLDITISSRDGNGHSPLKTTFYNKFSKAEFAALALIRYTHNTSNLARRLKDNILTGRFHALRRNITDKSSFCNTMASIIAQLIHRGYNGRRLLRRLFQLLKDYPYLYGDASRTTQQRIHHQLKAFMAENSL